MYRICLRQERGGKRRFSLKDVRENSFIIGKNNFNGRNIGLARIGIDNFG